MGENTRLEGLDYSFIGGKYPYFNIAQHFEGANILDYPSVLVDAIDILSKIATPSVDIPFIEINTGNNRFDTIPDQGLNWGILIEVDPMIKLNGPYINCFAATLNHICQTAKIPLDTRYTTDSQYKKKYLLIEILYPITTN